MCMRFDLRFAVLSVSLLALAGCVHSPPSDPWDPIESVNRGVFRFNRVADRYVVRPAASGYRKITPRPARDGIDNFFDNLKEPVVMANSLAQLKWGRFNESLGRFMINSTVGIVGFVDVATQLDIPDPDEDLGQTFGHWGLGTGPYIVLPLLGPSNGRDFLGALGDRAWAPSLGDIDTIDDDYGYLPWLLNGLHFLDERARLLDLDSVIEAQLDPYVFVREYYLRRREDKVEDRTPVEPLSVD